MIGWEAHTDHFHLLHKHWPGQWEQRTLGQASAAASNHGGGRGRRGRRGLVSWLRGRSADGRSQTKKSIGQQPLARPGAETTRATAPPEARGPLARCSRWPRRRPNSYVNAILKQEQQDIYFWTLYCRWRRSPRDPNADEPGAYGAHCWCKYIRTLTRNPLVTAADIRHRKPHRKLQAIRRSFLSRNLFLVGQFDCLWIRSHQNKLLYGDSLLEC